MTLCDNHGCGRKLSCYRFLVPANGEATIKISESNTETCSMFLRWSDGEKLMAKEEQELRKARWDAEKEAYRANKKKDF